MNRPGEKSERGGYSPESSGEENVTKQAYSVLGIELNEKNKTISKLLKKNRLKRLFDERKDSSLEQLTSYHRKMREILRDKYRKPFPTCAELDEDGNVIALFRQTGSVVSGGDSDPFLGASFIVGPQGVFKIGELGSFGQPPSPGTIRVAKVNSREATFEIPSRVADAKALIEEFEADPFGDENSGNLAKVINRSGL
jgi:hypothetical protein